MTVAIGVITTLSNFYADDSDAVLLLAFPEN
jgi:hypothetical protein